MWLIIFATEIHELATKVSYLVAKRRLDFFLKFEPCVKFVCLELLIFLQENFSHGPSQCHKHQQQLENQQRDVSQEHPLQTSASEEFTQGGQHHPQGSFHPGGYSQENYSSAASQANRQSPAMQANQVNSETC